MSKSYSKYIIERGTNQVNTFHFPIKSNKKDIKVLYRLFPDKEPTIYDFPENIITHKRDLIINGEKGYVSVDSKEKTATYVGNPSFGSPKTNGVIITPFLSAYVWFPIALEDIEHRRGLSLIYPEKEDIPFESRAAAVVPGDMMDTYCLYLVSKHLGHIPVMGIEYVPSYRNIYSIWRDTLANCFSAKEYKDKYIHA